MKDAKNIFASQSLEWLTLQLNTLEVEINRQQRYIAKHGEFNDLHSDDQWELYKAEAAANLATWDAMKAARDYKKAA